MAIKFDTPVFTGDMNIINCYQTTETWNELDMSSWVGSKPVKVLLYFEVTDINEDGTEYVQCKVRPKGEVNIQPYSVMTRYCWNNLDPENTRDKIGVLETWTDSYGCIEWYSEYNYSTSSPNKTVTLQIKIKAMVD